MTPSKLKYNVQETGSHFFDRKTLKFFGDTMTNYGCFSQTVTVKVWNNNGYKDNLTEKKKVWCLWRKLPVKHNNRKTAYFDQETFEQIHPIFKHEI